MLVKESDYIDSAVKVICYSCGSPTARQSYNYFRRIAYVTKGKVWCKGNTPMAFYYATKCRDHVRLIEIAVHKDYQRQGLGRKLLYRLLSEMRDNGFRRLTFRTPQNEDAQYFWSKMGARIIDIKGGDYEMELNIG